MFKLKQYYDEEAKKIETAILKAENEDIESWNEVIKTIGTLEKWVDDSLVKAKGVHANLQTSRSKASSLSQKYLDKR